ncbi:uncharacterized protein LOC115999570 [Ipomoea triloba]|uniref:uncharacterized protein LOC115999570 n=1 Tax=Ipomoea triloba TaxID=35885 RepID=UPI00125CF992|nr:uncharacterized protein LOC115999570 [Ipomoea triloba]
MAATSSTVSLKLLIDKKTRKVVFAEADKAFVDFLFHLMSLPLGTVIKLVNHNSMAGSLGSLYGSIQNISDAYLQPNVDKDALLNPKVAVRSPTVPLLMAPGLASETKKFYVCSGCNAYANRQRYISEYPDCGLKVLKAALHTDSVLTTVFLPK